MSFPGTILMLFAPLLGGMLAFFTKRNGYAIGGNLLAFVISIGWLLQPEVNYSIEWLPGYEINWRIDSIAALLIVLVLLVSLLVQVFSLEYMKADPGKFRYFIFLGLFIFSMVGLLMADHLILLFVFWELVGVCSYLLIGFWYSKGGIPSSARLAFMINRIADVALLVGILLVGSMSKLHISILKDVWPFLPSLLIAIGAFGKSAQLPFSGWLTKAMVGPTPISALIHAATMVAAGVYLLCRIAPFLHADVMTIIASVGAVTSLYGAVCALFQHDIKKVLAYSTISQLGYMVMGVGVGGIGASLFHLFTHAFFKACLFLGAGAIIHSLHQVGDHDPQDMRNMGGLKQALPWTFRTFLISALALVGVPFFSGFMSKEGILVAGWAWADRFGSWQYLIPDVGFITAFLTAMYVGRMLLLVFWGKPKQSVIKNKLPEVSAIKIPLIVLAIGSFWFWYEWNPLDYNPWFQFILPKPIISSFSSAPVFIMALSILLTLSGLVLAFSFFKTDSSYSVEYNQMKNIRFKIVLNGFYLVQAYEKLGRSVERISYFTYWVDRRFFDGIVHFLGIWTVVFSKVIALMDRFVVDGSVRLLAYLSGQIGRAFASLSSHKLQKQLAWLILGLILILSWILFV